MSTLYTPDQLEEMKARPSELLEEITENDFEEAINQNQNPDFKINVEGDDLEKEIEDEITDEVIGSMERGDDVNVADFMDGKDAVEILDIVMSTGCVIAAKATKLKANEKDFEATPANKKTLAKIFDRWLATVKLSKLSPGWLLLIAIVVIYGSKFGKIYVSQKMLDEAREEGREEGRKEARVISDDQPKKGPGRPKGSFKKK